MAELGQSAVQFATAMGGSVVTSCWIKRSSANSITMESLIVGEQTGYFKEASCKKTTEPRPEQTQESRPRLQELLP